MALVLAALAAVMAACSSSPDTVTSTTSPPPKFYVSLGDSYAAGYQATGPGHGHTDTNGFAYQVPGLAARKGYNLKLVNFGCAGATTESIITSPGCAVPGPGAPTYSGQTQAAAAEAFLRRHRGRVALVTVSIGGNDLIRCALSANPLSCVTGVVSSIGKNLTELLRGIRAAAGATVPIVGTTYPDVLLDLDLSPLAPVRSLGAASVSAFKLLFNPELERSYAAVGAKFADVTAATGAYGPLGTTTELAPYGRIPVPVAKVCELTFFCQYHDIHPRTPGYRIIAELVVKALPRFA